jgi:hypothetical protein
VVIVRTADVPVEIRTEYIPNTNEERYHWANQFSLMVLVKGGVSVLLMHQATKLYTDRYKPSGLSVEVSNHAPAILSSEIAPPVSIK